ncbi:MAG TPA: STAS domain-containing protein [Streptomyces sp.]|uniref:STAS domain-containing protein n=1 Tax=Streptomyces sp. TaxID=1931 RepID=UPI002D74EB22|nr:STAS domain-containing protein [Streptomyces sp.]HZG05925.1 STAS domain-containing protein [Streptomyces sp.]
MAAHEEPQTPRTDGPVPGPETITLVLAADAPITRADIPRLCERLRRLLSAGRAGPVAAPVTVEMGEFSAADLVTVEALARLQLTARRLGRRLRLGRADGELRRLLTWTGLYEEAFAAEPGTGPRRDPAPDRSAGVEPRGQAEQREEPGGVQERVEPGDPPP